MASSRRPRAIHQLSVSGAYGDAIGNELLQIRDALRHTGHHSEIFVELIHPSMANEVRPYREYAEVSDPDNVVLLHYSIGSETTEMARSLDDRVMLIYHNITPAEWFAPYDLKLARHCWEGRRELASLSDACDMALGDSEYNRRELEELGFSPTGVLPLIMDLSQLDEPPDPVVLERYDDDRTNLLFVGRVVPNKRIEDLIRAFAYFRRYVDHRSRLIIVGEYSGFRDYYHALARLVDRLRLDEVHFTGHIPQADLNAFYRVADCFLCASEHEGFCVPIFEAIHFDLPVLAYEAAAIPFSTGRGVLLLRDKDPALMGETIGRVLADESLRERLLGRQRRALRGLEREQLVQVLLGHVDRVMGD